MVLLFFQHTFLPTSMWRPIICPRIGCFQNGIFCLGWLKQLFILGAFQRWTCWPSLYVSGKLHVSSSCISSSGSVQLSARTCQRSTQMVDSGGTMLDGGSLAPQSSQHVSRHSSVVSHHKRSHHACLSRPGTQGSAISTFNPLAAQ